MSPTRAGNFLRIALAAVVLVAMAGPGHACTSGVATEQAFELATGDGPPLDCSLCSAPASAKLAATTPGERDATPFAMHGFAVPSERAARIPGSSRSRAPPLVR